MVGERWERHPKESAMSTDEPNLLDIEEDELSAEELEEACREAEEDEKHGRLTPAREFIAQLEKNAHPAP